jgi:hypothetical protein
MYITLSLALQNLTKDLLLSYAARLTTDRKPHTKADIAKLVEQKLKGDLEKFWNELEEIDKLAISEALYSSDGRLDLSRFRAKYGKFPTGIHPTGIQGYDGYSKSPSSLLNFFLYRDAFGYFIPEDLLQPLKKFTPKPIPLQLATALELPNCLEKVEEHYQWQEDDEGITVLSRRGTYKFPRREPKVTQTTKQIPISKRDMEFAAQQDLQTVLRLIAKGKVTVSDKTSRVSAVAAKEIAALLSGGDFFEIIEKKDKWAQEIGPIKAFAWALLAQTAKLAEIQGKKLALTKAGLNALNNPCHETLRKIWQHWLKTSAFDEFERVDVIKGQGGKGGRSMTAVANRRTAITLALSKCPVGQWIKLDEFSCFMQAAGIHFEVTHNPWGLYISDQNYGSLGDSSLDEWSILQARYISCFLFEYAATLGLIDVAYVSPKDVNCNYTALWGTDDLAFLSRYDGLLYFRLNALGAYCLGLSNQYTPQKSQARAKVSVLPSLQISFLEESPTPECALLLDTYAEQEAPGVWRLTRNKALAAVEEGHQIAELREFLQSCDEQPLPETVEAFISNTDKQARALRTKGLALLIECTDTKTAETIAQNKCTKDLCKRAGDKDLVVLASLEKQFRKAVNILGYGMPKVNA